MVHYAPFRSRPAWHVRYEHARRANVKLPPRQSRAYVRPPRRDQNLVPLRYLVE